MIALRVAACVLVAFALRAATASGRDSYSAADVGALAILQQTDGVAERARAAGAAGEAPLPFWLARAPHGRWLGVLFGTLTVAALFGFGSRAFSPRTGWIAAGLMAISPFFIHDSARLLPHSLFALLSVLQLWAAWRLGRTARMRDALLWGVVAALAILTNWFAVCAVAATFVYLLVRDRRFALLGVAALPILAALCVPVAAPTLIEEWGPQFDRPVLFARYALGTSLAFGLFLLALLHGYRGQRAAPRPVRLAFGLCIAASVGAALIAWPIQKQLGLFLPRNLGGAAAVALLPVAYSLALLFEGRAATAWAALGLLVTCQQVDGRAWLKQASPALPMARFVMAHEKPSDLLLSASQPAWTAFHHHYEGAARRPHGNAIEAAQAQLKAGGRIWFVGSCDVPFDTPKSPLLRALQSNGDLAYQWEGIAVENHQPMILLLFQPCEQER